MKVKVCGLKEPNNIDAIANLGVDYVGFIFYDKSPRNIKGSDLEQWLNSQEDFGPKKVGVFVNAEIDFILNTVHDYNLDYVQLHGNESPAYCGELKVLWSVSSVASAKIIKAFSVDEEFDFEQTAPYAAYCPLFLFDTKGAQAGGNGVSFEWELLDQYRGATPFILSGGIGPNDVEKVKKVGHPQLHGIDLNSRFETQPGQKDVQELSSFLTALGR